MKFSWDEFLNNDEIAVRCKTEEEAWDFCKQMHEHGRKWNSGESYLCKIKWLYQENTVYFSDGTLADIDYCERHKCQLVEWSDV